MRTLILLLMTCGVFFAAAAPEAEWRKQAEKLEKDGNWREAYELRVKLLRKISDKASGKDLSLALNSQNRLREQKNFDALLDELTVSRKDNPDFMLAAGQAYLSAQHYGQLLDDEFQRGSRVSGEWKQVQEQDRLRALQCYIQAWDKVKKGGKEEVQVLRALAGALNWNRNGGYLWRLYLKADLAATPDYTEQDDVITSSGAPVGKDGELDYINMPESWETAASDGERWRWLMAEIARISPADGSQEMLGWLRFCQQNYGVNTLASYGWW